MMALTDGDRAAITEQFRQVMTDDTTRATLRGVFYEGWREVRGEIEDGRRKDIELHESRCNHPDRVLRVVKEEFEPLKEQVESVSAQLSSNRAWLAGACAATGVIVGFLTYLLPIVASWLHKAG